MNSVASTRRPTTAEVRPGSELYERIIRALRGEQWRRTFDLKSAQSPRESRLKEYHSRAVANTTEENSPIPFSTRYSENFLDIETPPTKRFHHVHNGAVENNEQTTDMPSTPSNTTSSTNSTRLMTTELSSEAATGPVMKSPPATLVDNSNARAVQCSVAQKLQKISAQVDKTTCSIKPKPQSKYKPPYKIEKSHKPILSTKKLKQTEICCDPSSGKMTYRLNQSSDNQPSLEQPVIQARGLQKIACMSEEELATIELLLEKAEEVVCSLYFSNGSWQLREVEIVKTSKRSEPSEIDGICISTAFKKDNDLSSKHLLVPLDSSQSTLHGWSRRILCALMANEKCSKICYGAQEMVEILYIHFNLSITDCVQWKLLDVQVGCWLLDPDHPPHSYADCCKLLSTDYSINDKEDVDREQLLCTDMLTLVTVMSTLCSRLKSSELWQLYYELEVKIIPLLAVMQSTGLHLNTNKLLQYSNLIKTRMTMIEMEAHKMAGHSFLLSSTHQLRQVLFDELALHEKCQRSLSKTASQKFTSTSEHVLTQLQDVHPLPGLILEYRQFAKTKSTYIDGILPYISNKGILRPFWVHTGTATGRLVSINPNIQAFPKQPINLGVVEPSFIAGKDDVNVEIFIREAVESRKDYSFLSADFKSIELRVLAHFSCDNGLLKVLHQSDHHSDVFISLACYWLHVKADQVSSAEREKTKRIVYAVVYGIGKDKLADILNIHPSHAKELMESFLAQFPGVQMFIQSTIATCRKQGYVITLMNRRRYFPNINNNNFMNRSHAERQAVNFVIQGSAADICKTAMLRVMETLIQFTSQARLLLQIHDELLFELPTKDLQKLADIIHTSLESHKEILTVPLHVRISTGQTWASLQPLN